MGGALQHALTRGVATTLVVGVLVVLSPGLPATPAQAVSTARPIAVAVAPNGTSYVGFASGDRLLRLTAAGAVDGSVPLDRDDPVTALDVSSDGHVWVDYGASVSELAPDGDLLTHFPHEPSASCPADAAHDPARYGGIQVTADAVYVAGRCAATIGIYGHQGGLKATIDLPGTDYPRGLALAPAARGLPARLYVSVPASGKVFAYNAGTLRSDPEPARTLVIRRPDGFRDPEPGALVADEKGQLAVVDIANNAMHFYNGPENYWYYRTLGHPPDPASDRGFLDRPTAVDHVGDGFKRGFWVADSGNGRIQHWDHIGTTDWMTDAMPPGDPGAPVNTGPPEITGKPYAGRSLSCSTGSWDGDPASYDVAWLRDGLRIAGAVGDTYTVAARDVSTELACEVTATGAGGATSSPASSAPFPIPGPDSPPYIVERPVIHGQARSGSVLRCSTGTWTDKSPKSYVWGWLRDGQQLAGTNAREYLVTDNDVFHEVSCRVAAVNKNGTGKAALSDGVIAVEGGGGGGLGRPENRRRPAIVGLAAVGSELYCDPGTWDGAPTFTYLWQRDGEPIGGSEKDRYTVLGEDKRRALTCVVTGTNPHGSDRATSPARRPTGSAAPDPDPQPSGGGGCQGSPAVLVDGGARYTRDPKVVLRVRAPADATAVMISNGAGFRDAVTRPLASNCLYSWTLSGRSSRTPKVVRVRFPGATSAGTLSDRIVLDRDSPRLEGVDGRWSNPRHAWVLKIRASDRGTGIAKVEVGKSKGKTRTVAWGRPVASRDSSKLRWVRVVDRAGNASRWHHLTRF